MNYDSTYVPTSYHSLIYEETVMPLKNGKFRVSGKAIDSETNTPYDNIPIMYSKVSNKARLIAAQNEVRTKLEEAYIKLYGPNPANADDMRNAFERVKAKVYNEGLHLTPRWKDKRTNTQAITFFERNVLELILPFANPKERPLLDADRQSIRESLLKSALRRNNGNEERARETVERQVRNADMIYMNMRDQDERLPELRFSSDAPIIKAPRKEQLKHLSRDLLMKFYRALPEYIASEAKKVFFSIFVVLGLRPAEAAARKPSDIVWHETYCVAEVNSQERNGILDTHLKNNYSRRVIIIPYWGRCLLKMCCDVIGEDYPKDNTAMNDASKCSTWVKDLLKSCGVSDNVVNIASAAVEEDDYDADETSSVQQEKIVCYVLRRIFAGIARHIMGLSSFETDRLMGHVAIGSNGKKADRRRHVDLNATDTQKVIAEKMERYIFDPRYSLNPACTPIEITNPRRIELREFSEYALVNNSDMSCVLELHLDAAETGETIKIEVPENQDHAPVRDSFPKTWSGQDRTIIGDTTLPKGGQHEKKED